MNDDSAAQLEGLLFALGKPLSKTEVLKMLEIDAAALEQVLRSIGNMQGRGVVVVDDGKWLELRVAPDAAELVERVRRDENARDIGRAGLEVLSAILYRGPLSRSEIDFVRGVNSSATLRTLGVRGLVRRIPNPKDERSFLYEATTELLSTLGATHAHDLPDFDEVREKLTELESSYRAQLSNSEPQ